MSVAPRLTLALASLAVSVPAAASPYTDAAETAVFSLCFAFHEGRITGHRPTALTRLGYRRRPEIEGDEGDAEDGVPFIFTRGGGADEITIHYWAFPDRCSVSFSLEQGAEALAQVQARLEREPRRYRPVPDARWTAREGHRQSWLSARPRRMCVAIGAGYFDGAPTAYATSSEPYPVLHPGMARSECDPHPEAS